MNDCPKCGHSSYWHEQRRAEEPSQFLAGPCLCGCAYYVITSYVERS